jgi:hypothetical protein
MSYLVFDGDENRLSLFEVSGKLVGSWPASNRGGPASDFHVAQAEAFITFLPDGEYQFELGSQSVPQKHLNMPELDMADGKFGSLGILRLEPIKYGGQFHRGIGIHAGRQSKSDAMVISRKPLQQIHNRGPYYRTNGCIRTTEAAMHRIAVAIAKDPLKFLRVQNNGINPIGKESGFEPKRLSQ